MNNTTGIRYLLIAGINILLFSFAQNGKSQSIARQSITSYGISNTVGNTSISQTAGQPFSTKSSGKATALQGFQQSVNFRIEKVPTQAEELEIQVYPNPAQYTVNIEVTSSLKGGLIRVSNTRGETIYEKQLTDTLKHQINCQNWLSGIYFISSQDNSQKQTVRKLIITK